MKGRKKRMRVQERAQDLPSLLSSSFMSLCGAEFETEGKRMKGRGGRSAGQDFGRTFGVFFEGEHKKKEDGEFLPTFQHLVSRNQA